jgi:tetrahydromethanopterin S-methyltransferase subunit E
MLFAGDKQPSILYANSCQQVHDGIIDNIWPCPEIGFVLFFLLFGLVLFFSSVNIFLICSSLDSGRHMIDMQSVLLTLSVGDKEFLSVTR